MRIMKKIRVGVAAPVHSDGVAMEVSPGDLLGVNNRHFPHFTQGIGALEAVRMVAAGEATVEEYFDPDRDPDDGGHRSPAPSLQGGGHRP